MSPAIRLAPWHELCSQLGSGTRRNETAFGVNQNTMHLLLVLKPTMKVNPAPTITSSQRRASKVTAETSELEEESLGPSVSESNTAATINAYEDSSPSLFSPEASYCSAFLKETKAVLLDFSTASPSINKKGVVQAFQAIVSPLAEPEFAPRVPHRKLSGENNTFYLTSTAHGRLERSSRRGRITLSGALPPELALQMLCDKGSRNAPRRPIRRPTDEEELELVSQAASSTRTCSGLSKSMHTLSTDTLHSTKMPQMPQRRNSCDSTGSVGSFVG